jgi:hypothetical protein
MLKMRIRAQSAASTPAADVFCRTALRHSHIGNDEEGTLLRDERSGNGLSSRIWNRGLYHSVRQGMISAFALKRQRQRRPAAPSSGNSRNGPKSLPGSAFYGTTATPVQRCSQYYRKRADQLRAAASASSSSDDRRTLICFAADFDDLAAEAARAEQPEPGDPKRG